MKLHVSFAPPLPASSHVQPSGNWLLAERVAQRSIRGFAGVVGARVVGAVLGDDAVGGATIGDTAVGDARGTPRETPPG